MHGKFIEKLFCQRLIRDLNNYVPIFYKYATYLEKELNKKINQVFDVLHISEYCTLSTVCGK